MKQTTEEFQLKATCKIVDPDVEKQPLKYKYTYTWVNVSNPRRSLGRGEEFIVKDMPQGKHEYTVIVKCGELQSESTATFIVDSGSYFEKYVSIKYNAIIAQ